MTVNLKKCSICGKDLPLTEFNSKRSECRECSKGLKLQQRYGLSQDEYNEQLEAQNGVCLICLRSPEEVGKLHVDHDHDHCGPNKSCSYCRRGLICKSCNVSLGAFDDDIDRIIRAAEYLKKFERNNNMNIDDSIV